MAMELFAILFVLSIPIAVIAGRLLILKQPPRVVPAEVVDHGRERRGVMPEPH